MCKGRAQPLKARPWSPSMEQPMEPPHGAPPWSPPQPLKARLTLNSA